jgi:hypothetical protein
VCLYLFVCRVKSSGFVCVCGLCYSLGFVCVYVSLSCVKVGICVCCVCVLCDNLRFVCVCVLCDSWCFVCVCLCVVLQLVICVCFSG